MNNKALALLSGGLDSTLAIKVVQEQGVDVSALNFVTPFCNCTSRSSGCKNEAARVAKELNIKIKIMSKGKEYLKIIKNPKFGYGKNMNPCIDCRIFMHKAAKEYMKDVDASFIITGEVLGQRPMSQRRDTINIIDRESGLKGLVLRPLSAGLFDPTLPEQEGIVDRKKLLKISGRSRKPQMELAKEYNLSDYQCPAGGCLLTDSGFARRIKDIFDHSDEINMSDIQLLKTGRHFRLDDETKFIVGREEKENNRLISYSGENYITIQSYGVPGPAGLLIGNGSEKNIDTASKIVTRYFKKGIEYKKVKVTHNGQSHILNVNECFNDDRINSMII